MTIEELYDIMKLADEPKYRANQVFSWLYKDVSFDEMRNLPAKLRSYLNENAFLDKPEIEKKLVSKLDGTVKYLFRLKDGECIESVVMKYKHGNSICISSQVGCKMGCAFCASTIGGKVRDLSAAEMINQIEYAQRDFGEKISSVVLMGIGEPLENYDNLLKFLKLINNKDGLNIGHRHISVSTSGMVDKIYKLADEKPQITLSVSLHAPNNEIRDKIMPINKRWPIEELLASLDYYILKTNRRISVEYTLIKGLNDSDDCARQLAGLLKNKLFHVNLISVNEIEERSFEKLNDESINRFLSILKSNGINATVRRHLGADINASCGQLRRKRQQF